MFDTCAVGMLSMPFCFAKQREQPITEASVCALLLPVIHSPHSALQHILFGCTLIQCCFILGLLLAARSLWSVPWLPTEARTWCFLAELVCLTPIMAACVTSINCGSQLLGLLC